MQKEPILFRPVRTSDFTVVKPMIKALYESLGADHEYMTDEKIDATFSHLFSGQHNLWMEIIELDKKIIGYALLFDYWYNEYGGKVLQLDELYIDPEGRGKGIASAYIKKCAEDKNYKAIQLEVLPENTAAYRLYKSLGFEEKETKMLYRI